MRRTLVMVVVVTLALGGVAWLAATRLGSGPGDQRRRARGPAPVEVSPVEHGPIERRRTFTGALDARRRFAVAAHVSGRVQHVFVDLADPVDQGQVIVELDDDDQVQGVHEANAALAAARANLGDADSALAIAKRELDRLVNLEAEGVVSPSELDRGRAQHLARETAVDVARARVQQASAALERAKLRSGYTRVVARWTGDDARRVVAERHVDEGDMVSAGAPLITIVSLAPIDAIVHVTEKEYGQLRAGQPVAITTDAFPDRPFHGAIKRLAPEFSERSRQARVEIEIGNDDHALKPGMFVRAEVVLERVDNATIVPVAALTIRDGNTGVFLVDAAGTRVTWCPIDTGIRHGDRVQVRGGPPGGMSGRVVTLGHQLIADGAAITVPDPAPEAL